MKYHLQLLEWLLSKTPMITSVGEDAKKREPLWRKENLLMTGKYVNTAILKNRMEIILQ